MDCEGPLVHEEVEWKVTEGRGAKHPKHVRMAVVKAAAAGRQLWNNLSAMAKGPSGVTKGQLGKRGHHDTVAQRGPSMSQVSPVHSEEAVSGIPRLPSAFPNVHPSFSSPASPPKTSSKPSESHKTGCAAAPVSPITGRGRSGMNGSSIGSPASPSAIPRPGRGSTSQRSSGFMSPGKADCALQQAGTAEVTSPIRNRALKQSERGSVASHVDRIRAAKVPSALPSSPVHHPTGNTTTDRAPRRAPTSPEGRGKTATWRAPGSPPFIGTKTSDGGSKHLRRNVAAKSTGAAKSAGLFVESPSKLARRVAAGSGDEAPGSAAQTTEGSEGAGGGAGEAQIMRGVQLGQHRWEANVQDNITVRGVIYTHPFCDTPQDVSGDVADAGADVTAANSAASSLEMLTGVPGQGRDAAMIQVHLGFADYRNEATDEAKEFPGEIRDLLHPFSLPEPSDTLSSAAKGALGDAAGTLGAAAGSILDDAAAVPPVTADAAAVPPVAADAAAVPLVAADAAAVPLIAAEAAAVLPVEDKPAAAAVPPSAANAAAVPPVAADAAAISPVAAADRDPDPAARQFPEMAAKEADASIKDARMEAESGDPGATTTLFEAGQDVADYVSQALDDPEALARTLPAGQKARDSSPSRARAKVRDGFKGERSTLPPKFEALGLEADQAVEKKHGWQERESPAEATGRTSVAPKRKMAVEEQAGHGRTGAGKMDVGGLEALFYQNPLFGAGETLADDDLGAAADARGPDDDAAAYAPATTAGRETGAAARAFGAIGARRESRPPPRFAGLLSGGPGNAEDGDGGLPLEWKWIGEEAGPFKAEAMRAQAARLEAELAAAQEALQTAEQENQATVAKVVAMEEQANQLQKLVDKLGAAGVEKDGAIGKLEESLTQLERAYMETAAQLAEDAADKHLLAFLEQSKLQEDTGEELQAVTTARHAAEKAVEQLTAKLDAARALEAELAELQGSKIVLEKQLQALTAERDENSRLFHAAQQASADLRTTVSSLQQDLDDATEKLTTAEEERTAVEAKLHVVLQEKDEAARAVSAAQSEMQALAASSAELQKKFNNSEKQLKGVNERLLLSIQEKIHLQAQVAQMEEALGEMIKEKDALKTELDAEKGNAAGAAARVSKLQAALAASEQRVTVLRAEHATWQAESARIQAERDGALSAEATWRAEAQRLVSALAAAEKEKAVFHEAIDGYEERLTEEGRTAEAEAAAEREAELERQMERLQAQVAALKQNLEQARGPTPAASAKKAVAELQGKTEALKQKLARAEREKGEASDEMFKTMSEKLATQRTLHQQALQEEARKVEELSTNLEGAKHKAYKAEQQREALEQKVAQLTNAINASGTAKERVDINNRIAELEKEAAFFRKEAEQATAQLRSLSRNTACSPPESSSLPGPPQNVETPNSVLGPEKAFESLSPSRAAAKAFKRHG
ncbi:hypothetical protein KFL_005810060 [Klebsormidium nitens]|uniref:Uncharacterized protein n=1 Tax=Klebsormidium nitens TaxID=105231 RepID=A0A1Y1IH33_KLENI|nr:hypothetical protein KFL_005810060 [Klebsormidium nitens]|eukprot:GAQ89953.1 hypothetical protein KFL_005810060 [Klebsormidium nitens]